VLGWTEKVEAGRNNEPRTGRDLSASSMSWYGEI